MGGGGEWVAGEGGGKWGGVAGPRQWLEIFDHAALWRSWPYQILTMDFFFPNV
jgi:hypothetical protein